jgi:hypothetical protein
MEGDAMGAYSIYVLYLAIYGILYMLINIINPNYRRFLIPNSPEPKSPDFQLKMELVIILWNFFCI